MIQANILYHFIWEPWWVLVDVSVYKRSPAIPLGMEGWFCFLQGWPHCLDMLSPVGTEDMAELLLVCLLLDAMVSLPWTWHKARIIWARVSMRDCLDHTGLRSVLIRLIKIVRLACSGWCGSPRLKPEPYKNRENVLSTNKLPCISVSLCSWQWMQLAAASSCLDISTTMDCNLELWAKSVFSSLLQVAVTGNVLLQQQTQH